MSKLRPMEGRSHSTSGAEVYSSILLTSSAIFLHCLGGHLGKVHRVGYRELLPLPPPNQAMGVHHQWEGAPATHQALFSMLHLNSVLNLCQHSYEVEAAIIFIVHRRKLRQSMDK